MKPIDNFLIRSQMSLALLFLVASHRASAQAPVELITNGGFETTRIANNSYKMVQAPTLANTFQQVAATGASGSYQAGIISGWNTTAYATDVPGGGQYVVEVWNGNYQSPSQAPGAHGGTQYAEMNSVAPGTLFQTISGVSADSTLYLSFWHSSRGSVSSSMRVSLFDLGSDGVFNSGSAFATPSSPNPTVGGDDTLLINYKVGPVTFNSGATPVSSNWTFYNFQLPVQTNHTLLLSFQSITSGSVGNFLDDVSLTNVSKGNLTVAPEPSDFIVSGVFIGILGWLILRKRRA